MAKILILAAANISTCPRPMRMLELLKDDILNQVHEVSVMGIDSDTHQKMPPVSLTLPLKSNSESSLNSESSPQSFFKNPLKSPLKSPATNPSENSLAIPSFSYPAYKKRSKLQELFLWLNVALSRWDSLALTHNRLHIIEHLKAYRYDVIICHDLLLLPVLFKGLAFQNLAAPDSSSPYAKATKAPTKVIFDAREFYPLQNTSSLRWRLLFKRFNEYLCQKYAKRADIMLSVSPHFCHLYKKHFHLNTITFMSLPPYFDLEPKELDSEHIKILYHGALNQNRGIDEVIELITHLEGRFSIDFIFTGGERAYRTKIESKAYALIKQGYRIRLLPPVSLEAIIPFGHSYDLGLLYVPVHNHNLRATLPNKLFEYIQSRLGIIMPPLESASEIVSLYHNAAIAQDFSVKALAKVINALSTNDIKQLKNASHKAAKELNLTQNAQILHACLKECLKTN